MRTILDAARGLELPPVIEPKPRPARAPRTPHKNTGPRPRRVATGMTSHEELDYIGLSLAQGKTPDQIALRCSYRCVEDIQFYATSPDWEAWRQAWRKIADDRKPWLGGFEWITEKQRWLQRHFDLSTWRAWTLQPLRKLDGCTEDEAVEAWFNWPEFEPFRIASLASHTREEVQEDLRRCWHKFGPGGEGEVAARLLRRAKAWLAKQVGFTAHQLAVGLGVTDRQARRVAGRLVQAGLVCPLGTDRNRSYVCGHTKVSSELGRGAPAPSPTPSPAAKPATKAPPPAILGAGKRERGAAGATWEAAWKAAELPDNKKALFRLHWLQLRKLTMGRRKKTYVTLPGLSYAVETLCPMPFNHQVDAALAQIIPDQPLELEPDQKLRYSCGELAGRDVDQASRLRYVDAALEAARTSLTSCLTEEEGEKLAGFIGGKNQIRPAGSAWLRSCLTEKLRVWISQQVGDEVKMLFIGRQKDTKKYYTDTGRIGGRIQEFFGAPDPDRKLRGNTWRLQQKYKREEEREEEFKAAAEAATEADADAVAAAAEV